MQTQRLTWGQVYVLMRMLIQMLELREQTVRNRASDPELMHGYPYRYWHMHVHVCVRVYACLCLYPHQILCPSGVAEQMQMHSLE